MEMTNKRIYLNTRNHGEKASNMQNNNIVMSVYNTQNQKFRVTVEVRNMHSNFNQQYKCRLLLIMLNSQPLHIYLFIFKVLTVFPQDCTV